MFASQWGVDTGKHRLVQYYSRSAQTAGWEGPIFLVGMPRSGTKLLLGLLSRHPRIRICDIETEFLPFLVRWVEEHGALADEHDFVELHAALRYTPYFTFRDAQPRAFSPREWARWCGERFDAAGLFEGLLRYDLQAPRGSGILWGDKSPGYITRLGMLAEQFPRSRVIHLVRDVRDYSVSIRKAWGKDVLRAADRWGRDVLATRRHCADQPARCVEVRYEDLVRSPATELMRLCDFLQVTFDPQMTQLARAVEKVGDARGKTDIVSANVGKHAGVLSRRELKAIESLAFDAMREYGYEPQLAQAQAHLGRASLGYRRLKDGLLLLRNDASRLGTLEALRFHAHHRRVSRA